MTSIPENTIIVKDEESAAKVLEIMIKIVSDEQRKITNAFWVSRIQKRIDELKDLKRKSPALRMTSEIRIDELEGLLKE